MKKRSLTLKVLIALAGVVLNASGQSIPTTESSLVSDSVTVSDLAACFLANAVDSAPCYTTTSSSPADPDPSTTPASMTTTPAASAETTTISLTVCSKTIHLGSFSGRIDPKQLLYLEGALNKQAGCPHKPSRAFNLFRILATSTSTTQRSPVLDVLPEAN